MIKKTYSKRSLEGMLFKNWVCCVTVDKIYAITASTVPVLVSAYWIL